MLLSFLRSMWGMVKLIALLLHASAQLLVRRRSGSGDKRQERALWLHELCRRGIETFGIDVRVRGTFPERGVLISNHLSYVDIVLFASIRPCVFVSKAEIESWPLLGWMTTMAGTVYVRRGRGGSAKEAGSGMRAAADAGLPVVFFPEGTTSSGETILKFHSGLLTEALAAEQPVTAAYLRYSMAEENGTATVREDVAYWGDRAMLPHIFRFLSLRGVRADLEIADRPIPFFAAGVASRKLIAVEARRAVCELSEECAGRVEEMEAVG